MSSTNNKTGINDKAVIRGIELRADTAVNGLQTALPPTVTQLVLGTVPYTIPNLVKYFQGLEQPWKDARDAHAVIRQVMQNRPEDYKLLLDALTNLKGALSGVLGHDSEDLTKFGFKPTKARKPLTSEQNAVRAAKAKLTRQKRGTLGKKQKAAIKETAAPTVTISPDGKTVITPAGSSAPGASQPAVSSAPMASAVPAGSAAPLASGVSMAPAAPGGSGSQAPTPVTQVPGIPPAPAVLEPPTSGGAKQ